jgi:hypothetical protein
MRFETRTEFRRVAMATLGVAAALLLADCGGRHSSPPPADQGQQQTLMRARMLCRDFGYTPGTMDFARCAQTEFDRMALSAPQPMPQPMPQMAPVPAPQAAQSMPQAAPAQAAPQATSDDSDWMVNWLKRPPVCGQAACTVR